MESPEAYPIVQEVKDNVGESETRRLDKPRRKLLGCSCLVFSGRSQSTPLADPINAFNGFESLPYYDAITISMFSANCPDMLLSDQSSPVLFSLDFGVTRSRGVTRRLLF